MASLVPLEEFDSQNPAPARSRRARLVPIEEFDGPPAPTSPVAASVPAVNAPGAGTDLVSAVRAAAEPTAEELAAASQPARARMTPTGQIRVAPMGGTTVADWREPDVEPPPADLAKAARMARDTAMAIVGPQKPGNIAFKRWNEATTSMADPQRRQGSALELQQQELAARARDVYAKDFVNNVATGVRALPSTVKQTMGGGLQAIGEALPKEQDGRAFADEWNGLRESAIKMGQDFYNSAGLEKQAIEAGMKPGTGAKTVSTALQSVAQMIPALTFGFGNPAAVISIMGTQSAAQAYGEARKEGYDPGKAGMYAVAKGLIEGGTEYLPVKALLAKHPSFASHFYNFIVREVPSEMLATTLESATDKLTLKPDMTWDEFMEDMKNTITSTPLSAGVLVGGARAKAALNQRALESPEGRASTLAEELRRAVEEAQLVDAPQGPRTEPVRRAPLALVQPGQGVTSVQPAGTVGPQMPKTLAEQVAEAAGPENRYDSAIAQHIERLMSETQQPLPQIEGAPLDLPKRKGFPKIILPEEPVAVGVERAQAGEDGVAQSEWLAQKASEAGYASVDDMVEKAPKLFTKLTEQWRNEEPTMVGVQRGEDLVKRDASGRIIGGFGADHINTVHATLRRMEKLAREGVVGKPWYEDSARAILQSVNGDRVAADRIAQVLAIASAGTEVKANFTTGAKALEQFARGEPIKVATGDKNRQLQDLLYHGIVPETIKVDDFYLNLAQHITGKAHDRPVTDRWQFRIASGDHAQDKGTQRQYEYTSMLAAETAKKLGWRPDEAQAAMWVAMKARAKFDNMKESVKKSANSKFTGKTDKELRALALDFAKVSFASEIEARNWKPPESAKFLTTEELRAAHQTLTGEVKPSTKTDIGQRAAKLAGKELEDFQQKGLAVVGGASGFLSAMGLNETQYTAHAGAGAYEGGIAPNVIASIRADKETVDRVARAWMYVFKQDAVPYFRADRKLIDNPDATRGVFVTVSNYAPGREKKFYEHLRKNVHEGIGYTRDGNTFLILNFHGQPVQEFIDKMDAALTSPGNPMTVVKAVDYGAESEYPYHDWQADPQGASLLDQASAGQSPNLRERLRGWADSFQQLAERTLPAEDRNRADGREAGGEGAQPLAVGVQRGQVTDEQDPSRPPAPGESFIVYRVGKPGDLKNSNGGNADSVARHIAAFDDHDSPSAAGIGTHITAYEVSADAFGEYRGVRGGEKVEGPVGRRVRGKEVAYTFPAGGFVAQEIGSVPLPEVRKLLAKYNGSFDDAGTNEGARAIREALASKVGAPADTEPMLRNLIREADRLKPKFAKFVEDLAQNAGGSPIVAPVKKYEVALEKVLKDYAGDVTQLKDLLRATVAVSTPQDVTRAYGVALKEYANAGMDVVKKVNRYESVKDGYRDAKTVTMLEGMPAEIQFNVPEMLGAKEHAHAIYRVLQNIERDAKGRKLTAREQEIVDAGYIRMNYLFNEAGRKLQERLDAGEEMSPAEVESSATYERSRGESLGKAEAARFEAMRSNSSSEMMRAPSVRSGSGTLRGGSVSNANVNPSDFTGTPSTSKNVAMDGMVADRGTKASMVDMRVGRSYGDTAFVGVKVANPADIFGQPKRGYGEMDDRQARSVAGAVMDLYRAGMPRYMTEGIDGWISFNREIIGYNAAFFPAQNAVGIRNDQLATTPELRSFIAHELTHRLDSLGTEGSAGRYRFLAISHHSPRLDFMVEDGRDGPLVYPTGDLFVEAYMAYVNDSLQYEVPAGVVEYLSYPLMAVTQANPDTIKSELFAQMGALYFTKRSLLKRHFPLWHEVMESIHGKTQNTEAQGVQADALAAARVRVQQALQVESAKLTSEVGGDWTRGFSKAGRYTAVGARQGPAGAGVGEGVGAKRERAAGDALDRADDGRGAAAGDGGVGVQRQPSSWNADQPGAWDAFVREWQNNQIDLKRVEAAIEKSGGVIRDEARPYLTEELYHGRVSEATKRFEKMELEPMLKRIADSGLKPDEVGKFLWARHAPERNAQMAKINPGGPADLSGMSNAEAAKVLASFTPAQRQSLNAIAADVDAITQRTREMLVREGLEDQSTIDAWEAAYKNYVPLFRDMDEMPGTGAGFKISGPESKRAMGSQREAVAILAAVAWQRERAIIRAEKASVGRDLIKLAEEFPNPDFWRIDQPPMKRRINPSTGMVENTIDPLYRQREDVLIVKERDASGKVTERVIAFNPGNERALRLSRAMQKLDVVELGAVTKIVNKVSRFLANLATQWNPVFWATNFVRDVQTASINLGSTPLKGSEGKVMARIMPSIAGIADAEFRNGTGTYAKWYREFEEHGGKTGWMTIFDGLVDRQKEIAKMVDKSGRPNSDPRVWADWTADVISKTNTAIENGTRLAAYVVAREQGMTERQAATLAKNLTVNFNRKGNRSSAANAWFMFLNANVQGNARMLTGLAKSRKAQAIVGVMAALGAALELLNRLIGDRDRDEAGNNPYELIGDWEKERNWIFMLPGSGKDGKPNYVKIPLPYGFNIFPSAGRLAMESVLTASKTKLVTQKRGHLDMAADFAKVLIDAFGPLGQTATAMQYVAPTVADPFVQVAENKSFTGAPLVPKRERYNQQLPASELYFNSNSELAKDMAKFLNEISGGSPIKSGAIDIHPGHIEHVFRTLTGGPGTFGMGMFDWGKNVAERAMGKDVEPVPTSRIPFVGKFYGEVDERAIEQKFYKLKEKADRAMGELKAAKKAGELDAAEKIEAESPELIEFAREAAKKSFQTERKEFANEMRETRDLPISERENAKRRIKAQQSQLYLRALEAYNSAAQEEAR